MTSNKERYHIGCEHLASEIRLHIQRPNPIFSLSFPLWGLLHRSSPSGDHNQLILTVGVQKTLAGDQIPPAKV